MRNTFVVLVSLCIGLASGFIVPSGVLELVDDNQAILADNNGKQSEEAKEATLQEDTGFIVLPFRTNNDKKMINVDLETTAHRIKDKELYDQDTTNHNNVNERSFIYINQKYKTPVVNQLYGTQDIIRDSFKSSVSDAAENYKQYPVKSIPNFSIPKSKKEFNDKPIETKNLYFPPANNQDLNNVLNSEKKHEITPKRLLSKGTEEQREYVELLKPPLLRPSPTSNKQENLAWSAPRQEFANIKPYTKNLHVPNLPIDPHQFSMKHYDNFGFPSPYGYQRGTPQFISKPEEVITATESRKSVKKVVHDDINDEANKFLDRYMKDSLEDHVSHERMHAKANNCNNCVMTTMKHLNSRVKEAECKCGRRLNILKQRDSGLNNKEPVTEKVAFSTEINTFYTPRSSEIADYGDMLAEEMNLKRLVED